MDKIKIIREEDGSVLVIALIMLVLLTLLGISATSTSNIELQIANNEKNYKKAFYTANAAIEHARAYLTASMITYNSNRLTQGQPPQWDFALNGTLAGIAAATGMTLAGSTLVVPAQTIENEPGYAYTVRVWNNDDSALGGSATHDADSMIWARADVDGPGNIRVVVDVLLEGSGTGEAITGYAAQAGAGAGKSYTSEDLNAVASSELTTSGVKTF
jgi:type IV pilus assembly protein PilX